MGGTFMSLDASYKVMNYCLIISYFIRTSSFVTFMMHCLDIIHHHYLKLSLSVNKVKQSVSASLSRLDQTIALSHTCQICFCMDVQG